MAEIIIDNNDVSHDERIPKQTKRNKNKNTQTKPVVELVEIWRSYKELLRDIGQAEKKLNVTFLEH